MVIIMGLEIKDVGMESIDLIIKLRMKLIKNNVFNSEEQNFESKDFDQMYENTKEYYIKNLDSGKHIMCLAVCDGVVAACGGACVYNEIPSWTNLSGKCGYIMNIYTKPEYRRKGIATAIVKHLIHRLKTLDVQKIYLRATKMGKSVYEKIGFSEIKNYMKLE